MRAIVLSALIVLAGCGPRFETRYSYTAPPDSPQSRQCLQGCEWQRQQCLALADNRFALCEMEARYEVYECRAEARYRYERCLSRNPDQPENCHYQQLFCQRPVCWRDDRHCGELYRSCYAACGGTVEAETYCVANCDEVPATPAPLASP